MTTGEACAWGGAGVMGKPAVKEGSWLSDEKLHLFSFLSTSDMSKAGLSLPVFMVADSSSSSLSVMAPSTKLKTRPSSCWQKQLMRQPFAVFCCVKKVGEGNFSFLLLFLGQG